MKLKKPILAALLLLTMVIFVGCSNDTAKSKNIVNIEEFDKHYEVTIDYSTEMSPRQVGEIYGAEMLDTVPDYESIIDAYLEEIIGPFMTVYLKRVEDIKPQIDQSYIDEIEGIASNFKKADKNELGDGLLSVDEFYILNLIPDISRGTQCSAISVYGEASSTGKTMSGRILDWYGGSENQIAKIQSVTTYLNEDKSICSIGYLGYIGILSGFNDDQVFAAILDSSTGGFYSSDAKRSYPLDIRYGLENHDSMDSFAEYMMSPDKAYTYSHLIFMSNPDNSRIIENNMAPGYKPEIRDSDSKLSVGNEWGIGDSIACVNSFLLENNYDNHSKSTGNTMRWESFKRELTSQGEQLSLDQLKEVVGYYSGEMPGSQEDGDLYNEGTQQVIIFEPETMNLEVFFRPKNGQLPAKLTFDKVEIKFD